MSEVRYASLLSLCSLICEELEKPRADEAEEDDMKDKENEQEAGERRRIRGEQILTDRFIHVGIVQESTSVLWAGTVC